jgi:hypothetical protein
MVLLERKIHGRFHIRGSTMGFNVSRKDEEDVPRLPRELERYLARPYVGLFGMSAFSEVVEEVVADPLRPYRPKDLEEATGRSAPTVRRVLAVLTRLGLLARDPGDPQHPVYRVVTGSRTFVALTLLALGVGDDRDGTDCMDTAMRNHYWRHLHEGGAMLAGSTFVDMDLARTEAAATGTVPTGGFERMHAGMKGVQA